MLGDYAVNLGSKPPWRRVPKRLPLYLEAAGLVSALQQLGFGVVGFATHHLQWHEWCTRSADPARHHGASYAHRGRVVGEPPTLTDAFILMPHKLFWLRRLW